MKKIKLKKEYHECVKEIINDIHDAETAFKEASRMLRIAKKEFQNNLHKWIPESKNNLGTFDYEKLEFQYEDK